MSSTHAPRLGHDRRPAMLARRVLSILLAISSVLMFTWAVYGIADVSDTYGNAFGSGWTVIWVLMGAVGSLFGGAAVVLWNPPERAGVARKAFLWVAGAIVLVFAVFFFAGPLF